MDLYCPIIIPSFSKSLISHFLIHKGLLYYLATLLKMYEISLEFYLTMKVHMLMKKREKSNSNYFY